jgi:hypothetical protein
MRKKFKEILIGDIKYAWTVKTKYPDNIKLCIWKDKKIIFEEILKDNINITPYFVTNFILQKVHVLLHTYKVSRIEELNVFVINKDNKEYQLATDSVVTGGRMVKDNGIPTHYETYSNIFEIGQEIKGIIVYDDNDIIRVKVIE